MNGNYESNLRSGKSQGTMASPAVERNPSSTAVDLLKVKIPDFPSSFGPLGQVFLSSKIWEGYVVSKNEQTFSAHLKDISEENIAEEEAELPISDINEDDLPLFEEGVPFFFSVGYLISASGTRQRCSRIRFRRLPKWTSDEIIDAREKAEARLKRFTGK